MKKSADSPPLTAFIIGPIGDKDADAGSPSRIAYEEGIQVFEEVIKPACAHVKMQAIRADMISRIGEIPEQIFRQLRDCPVVIADLTGANPNVMYELGLRHTTGKLTIQIGEKARLPFDVSAIRTVMFKRTASGLAEARKDLSLCLATSLETGSDPITATRIWFENIPLEQQDDDDDGVEFSLEPSDYIDDEIEPGFLELLNEMGLGTQSLNQALLTSTSILGNITEIYEKATQNVLDANARGDGASARLAIAERTAKQLDEQATKLEIVSGEYSNTVDRIQPGLEYLITRFVEDPKQLEEVPDFLNQVRGLCAAAEESIEGSIGMRDSALDIGKASRSLARVGRRLAPSFDRFSATSRRISDWAILLDKISPPSN